MGGRGYGGVGRGSVYTYHYNVTTSMTCIKMGSNESHSNVSLIMRDKVSRLCPQTTTFEEKGEPKQYRTEVLPLTSLPPYRWAKLALDFVDVAVVEFMYLIFTRMPGESSTGNSGLCCWVCFKRVLTELMEFYLTNGSLSVDGILF